MKSCPVPGIDPYQEEILQVSNKKKRNRSFLAVIGGEDTSEFL